MLLFFKFLVISENVKTNPVDQVKMPKFQKKEPSYLTEQEYKRLLRVVRNNATKYFKPRDTAIITILLGMGLRLNELVQLNIDIDKIWIIKKDTKEIWEGEYTKERLFSESIPYWQNHLRRRFHGPSWGSILVDIVVRLIDGNGNTCMLKVLNVRVGILS